MTQGRSMGVAFAPAQDGGCATDRANFQEGYSDPVIRGVSGVGFKKLDSQSPSEAVKNTF